MTNVRYANIKKLADTKLTEYKRHVDMKKLDFIISSLQNDLPVGSTGLDIGCNIGNISIPLASLGFKITGFDISTKNIKIANNKKIFFGFDKNLTFLLGDACNQPIVEKEQFDFVILSEVLEHVKKPEKLLVNINRVLKKDGYLIITVPNGFGPYSLVMDRFRNNVLCKIMSIPVSEHINYFSKNKICKLLIDNGFDIKNSSKSDFVSYFFTKMKMIVNSETICVLDCRLADLLPYNFVSGWYFFCKKVRKKMNKR